MPSQEEQLSLREERLKEWFQDKSNSQAWDDLVSKIHEMYKNTIDSLLSYNCQRRDYFSGKCSAYTDIIGLKEDYK